MKTEPVAVPLIQYTLLPADPKGHLFDVTLDVSGLPDTALCVSLPAWIPGSYMIRDFARHIVEIRADDGARRISLEKLDKHRWRARPRGGRLRLRYRVYAWDLSVRGAHFDESHAFFNGTSVFLRVDGHESAPCRLRLSPPPHAGDWRVATTLARAGARLWGFGDYEARDYDELIDHPVEMGLFETAGFEAGGARHEIVVTGRHDGDLERFTRDLQGICAAQARLFEPRGGRAPVDRYLFLLTLVGDGYGGLEHRASTALIANRHDMPRHGLEAPDEGYRRLLGLASHEYFHTWNVKRIKPAAFAPYRLDAESYTRLLWVFEGFTSYYDDLMVRRAGAIDRTAYLGLVGDTLSRVLAGPGRKLQSIAESSFDAWTKFYRQDENAGNAIVSYYAKGGLVALALDLAIRDRSAGRRSLDDVMRLMWRRYGRDFETAGLGIEEDAMAGLIEEATGIDLGREIRRWAESTEDPPLADLLATHGLRLTMSPAGEDRPWLGLRAVDRDGGVGIASVTSGGPGHAAGLSAGDMLVAVDGLRISRAAALDAVLARKRVGARLRIHAFRGDVLRELDIVAAASPRTKARIEAEPRPGMRAQRLLAGWLGRDGMRR
jgi:predicted metalloprotease with PDZ domain